MNPDIKPVVSANTKFSIDLLKVLCKDNTENVIFSPLSISSALGLVLFGAGGDTADQLNKVRLNLQIALYKLKSHVYECFKVDLLLLFLYRYSGKKNSNRIKYKTKQKTGETSWGRFHMHFYIPLRCFFNFLCKHGPCIFSLIQDH